MSFLTATETAQLLRVSRQRVYDLVHLGRIPYHQTVGVEGKRKNGRLLFDKAEVLAWLRHGNAERGGK